MVAESGATFGSEMDSWLAMLILKELDEVVKWCIDYYDVQMDSYPIATEVIYVQSNSLRSNGHHQALQRQKYITELEEDLAESSTKTTNKDTKMHLLTELQAKQAKEEELCSSISATKGARLLVEKWKVSKRTVVLSGYPTALGASGDVELLKLIWNYYKENRSEFQRFVMDTRLQATLEMAVKSGHSEFVKALLELTNEEELDESAGGMKKIVYLDTSGCLLVAAKQTGTLSMMKFLLENTNSQVTSEVFDAIMEHGDIPAVEWALINYASQFASKTSIEAAVNARNNACWNVGQWWAHKNNEGGDCFTESQLVNLSRDAFSRQQMLERLESIVGNNTRGAPPRSKEDVRGAGGKGDWIINGFKQAYECLKEPIPEHYLAAYADYVDSSASVAESNSDC